MATPVTTHGSSRLVFRFCAAALLLAAPFVLLNRREPGGVAAVPPVAATPATSPATSPAATPVIYPPIRLATTPDPTPEQIEAAIDRAKKYLRDCRTAEGHWEVVPAPEDGKRGYRGDQWGGLTAMAVYGLLLAGDNPRDTRVAPAIAWLTQARLRGVYALVFRAQVWSYLDRRAAAQAAFADTTSLLAALHADGPRAGFFRHVVDGKGPEADPVDLDVSQFGVWGMEACDRAGAEVPWVFWKAAHAAWSAAQRDGGWPHQPGEPGPQAAVTAGGAAAVATIARHRNVGRDWNHCTGGAEDLAVVAALEYLDRHVGELTTDAYGLWALRQAGMATGRRRFGGVDWYREGTAFLVRSQNLDGSFGRDDGGGNDDVKANPNRIPQTVFALAVLSTEHAPVMMNKLQYRAVGADGKPVALPWNQRPDDVAHLSAWLGPQVCERELGWHTVDLRHPAADDVYDAPILYIAGSAVPTFNTAEIDRLRQFVENGGLILGSADCSSRDFDRAFRALGATLFPRYPFRPLPPSHSIYVDQPFRASKWKLSLRVEGVSNGVRELMLFTPTHDLGRAWQVRDELMRREVFQLAANVYLYAIDKQIDRPRSAPPPPVGRPDPAVRPARRLSLARLMAGGNPDPEPAGWRRLAAILHNRHDLELDVKPVPLAKGALEGFQVAHLTGTTRLTLAPEQQAQLKAFVARGGTLIVDAAGGSDDFADTAEAALKDVFGAAADGRIGQVLAAAHAVYARPGARVEEFRFRRFARGKLLGRMRDPLVRGVDQGGRVAVFFSREDLSHGLLGQPVDGVVGYEPETATALLRNIILYAADGAAAPQPR